MSPTAVWWQRLRKIIFSLGSEIEVYARVFWEPQRFRYPRCIKIVESKRGIHKMRRGRNIGPNETLVEFWKTTGKADMEWLTGLFNVRFRMAKIPKGWRQSTMVSSYKNNGDIQHCNNY